MTLINHKILIKSASYAAVAVSFIITILKSYTWFATDSQSVLASLVDSLLDISSSVINLIAIRISLAPPDYNHRFGHDKFQDLAIFSQSIFFILSCCFTLFSSLKAIYFREEAMNNLQGVNVMYICIALTFLLVIYQSYVISSTKSKMIAVDKLHYLTDFMTNLAVVASLYISIKLWYIDALIGIAISAYLFFASYKLLREAIKNLSDEEFNDKEREKILQIISTFSQAKGVHELRTRSAGDRSFIQFHLELRGSISLYDAHTISDSIADELAKHFPKAEIIIHQDPV